MGKRRILVISGTAEARRLCVRLSQNTRLDVLASFLNPPDNRHRFPVLIRHGGFGGAKGLVRFVIEREIDLIADASHPFAKQITRNARSAADWAGRPYIRLERAAWSKSELGTSIEAQSLDQLFDNVPAKATAFAPLGSGLFHPHNVALLAKRKDVKFVLRVIEAPTIELPNNVIEVIRAPPPFSIESERSVLQRIGADCLLCRNSGGPAGLTKVKAAHELGLTLLVLARPHHGPTSTLYRHVRDAERAILALLSLVQ